MNVSFLKLANLSSKQKAVLKKYWTPLYGAEVTNALLTDFMTSGNKKKVEASSSKGSQKKN